MNTATNQKGRLVTRVLGVSQAATTPFYACSGSLTKGNGLELQRGVLLPLIIPHGVNKG
jgi:hypothetical protein